MKNAHAMGLSFAEALTLPHHWLDSIRDAPSTEPPSKDGERATWRPGTLYDAERLRALKEQFAVPSGVA